MGYNMNHIDHRQWRFCLAGIAVQSIIGLPHKKSGIPIRAVEQHLQDMLD